MILTHEATTVNPTPTDTELQTTDRMAWNNNSPDNDHLDGYPGTGWREDEPTGPTLEDEMYDSGYSIGLTGSAATVRGVFPQFSESAIRAGGVAFTMGHNAGRRRHAWRVGQELGQAGQFCERPVSVNCRFNREFEAGWQVGADEWADRQEIMAEWAAEAQADEQAKWAAQENAEAGGWYRAWGVPVD